MHYAQDHLKEIARKSIQASDDLACMFMHIADIDVKQAQDLVQFYIRKKLVKLDLCMGRYTVKHGVYLDREFIEHAVLRGAF
jgi:hypothetical protein